jgi:hypothetical protein
MQSLDRTYNLAEQQPKAARNVLTEARQKTASTGIYFVKYNEI